MGNPGHGDPDLHEHIGDERGALDPRQFAVERLGVGDWPATGEDGGVIALTVWRALTDSESRAVDPVCFAIDMPPTGPPRRSPRPAAPTACGTSRSSTGAPAPTGSSTARSN
jgi:hypothetical protein